MDCGKRFDAVVPHNDRIRAQVTPDCPYLIFIQNSTWVCWPPSSNLAHNFLVLLSKRMSPLFAHIAVIVGVIAKKKMVRINALSIIAQVADELSIRDLTVLQQPSQAMGLNTQSTPIYAPIPMVAETPGPLNAASGWVGLGAPTHNLPNWGQSVSLGILI
jgi:hypothetical protein